MRVLLIDKCQDCNAIDCKIRNNSNIIPHECSLVYTDFPDVFFDTLTRFGEIMSITWKDAPKWANYMTSDEEWLTWWEEEPGLVNTNGQYYYTGTGRSEPVFATDIEYGLYPRPEHRKELTK